MKEKIKQIVNRIESGDLAYHDAETELLDLFAVSQQRELLLQFSSHLNTYKGMEEIRFDFMVCDFLQQ